MNTKTSKLAMAVLALSLTQAASASENSIQNDVDNKSTYWGLGIGSVLGAVIAGPPGAAIGATLGGSLGWGKDQNDALDESLTELEQRELALQQNKQILDQHRKSLQQSQQEIQTLTRNHTLQTSRLNELEKASSEKQDSDFLLNLAAHYAQDIYFRSGQSEAPEYAQARLASLVELLKSHPDLRVTLKGYTDPFGSAKLNAALAQARVDGIKELLKTQGIDETRITGLAVGEVKIEPIDLQQNIDEGLSNLEIDDDQQSPEIRELRTADANTKQPKPKDHVLDRRVSIELSVNAEVEDQSIASLAVLKQRGANQ
tara:strand:+ start:14147 stop:15091 length:945 start_codon:yes stop_codon:yes gene_type:complete